MTMDILGLEIIESAGHSLISHVVLPDLYRKCSASYGYVFYIARKFGGHP